MMIYNKIIFMSRFVIACEKFSSGRSGSTKGYETGYSINAICQIAEDNREKLRKE
jgi:hypothetical protein